MSSRKAKRRQKRRDNLQNGADAIYQLTKVHVDQSQLYTESFIYSDSRHKLELMEDGSRVDLIRLPFSYLFAHCMLVLFTTLAIVTLYMAGKQALVISIPMLLGALPCYGFTYCANGKAVETNPVLSYHTGKQLLRIPSEKTNIPQPDLCFIMALASIPPNAYKPDSNRTELKLIYHQNGKLDSFVITNTTRNYLPMYDDEVRPLAELLKIPYLHVERSIYKGECSVNRIT